MAGNKLKSGEQAVVTGVFGDVTLAEVYHQLKEHIEIKDRSWMLSTYKQCADAKEMVDYLAKQPYCKSREKAVQICTDLQNQDAIMHVWGGKIAFRDTTMFFILKKEDTVVVADMYDVVVIGGGTAGISATGFIGSMGASVVMIEGNRIGGDCTWSGCIPSKSLIKCAHTLHDAKEAAKFGVKVDNPKADMAKVKDYVYDKIHYMAKHDLHILQEKNVPLRYGQAKFLDPHTLELTPPVKGDAAGKGGEVQQIKARSFILCLGAVASNPPIKGLDAVKFHTYETIFDVDVLPKKMCVVGGGVIGCELAQSFARLGSEVTLVASQLLPKEPKKVDELLSKQFEEDGIKIVRGRGDSVQKVGGAEDLLRLTAKTKAGELVDIECDLLLVAAGRRPNTTHMSLEAAGVKLCEKTKLIDVNATLQTSAAHIYAAGDCCTLKQFTHYASQMGVWAARNLLLPGSNTPSDICPRATFTYPEVASVGLTEQEARDQGYEVFSQASSVNERAVCEGDMRGFIDVYLDKNQMIMGACIMNQRAGELLTEILVAMEKKIPFTGLSLRQVIHPYPTYSWATMMLATEVDSKKFNESTAGKLTKWYVGR